MQHSYRTKGWAKRLGAMAMTLVMLFGLMAAGLPQAQAVTQDDINNLKSQAASLSSQKADIQKKLDKLSNSKNSALNEKLLLEQKINVLRSEIAVSEQAIAENGEMITQKESELAAAKEKEAKYYEAFCERVRSMEERGNVSYWSVIFNASSFSDLLDQVNAISEVMDYDNEIMDQLAKARQEVADAKTALEESKAAEETAKASLESQKADLQTEQAKVEATIQQITSQSSTYSSQMAKLENSQSNLANQIAQAEKQYQAQIAAQKAAEEAARQKAAKEAAEKAAAEAAAKKRQQEEEAKRQQQNANKNNNSSSSSNNSSSSNSSSNNSSSSSNSSSSGTTSSSGYLWPLSGYTRVSSPFGYRNCPYHGQELHGGCDVPAPSGTPIRAAKSGVVVISTYGSSYGNYVVIAHSDGSRTMYAHQSQRAVSAGQTVSQGQTIGYVGSTGNSTGSHLHFELWLSSSSSSRVNPVAYCG